MDTDKLVYCTVWYESPDIFDGAKYIGCVYTDQALDENLN